MPSVKDASPEVRVMGHPVRKRLIELLGERQSISFSELREETGLPVGTLYYHLDVLSGLIAQDGAKKYVLTKEGLKFYSEMAQKEGLPMPPQPKTTSLIPAWVFTRLTNSIPASLIVWIVVTAAGAYLLGTENHILLLMNIYPWQGGLLPALSYPFAMIVYYLFATLVSLASRRRVFSIAGFLATGAVYLPFLLVASLITLNLSRGTDIALIISQLISIILGTAYLTSVYGYRLERSFLIQLIYYVISTLSFFIITYG
jgi:hypothetical protein